MTISIVALRLWYDAMAFFLSKSNFSGLVVSCEKTVFRGGEPFSQYQYHNEKKYEEKNKYEYYLMNDCRKALKCHTNLISSF